MASEGTCHGTSSILRGCGHAYKQAVDSGLDLVILATHQHFRPMHFAYAVKQGKHVFMEKPMGGDVPGIRQVMAAGEEARKKNLKVGVGLYMRHSRRVQETLRRVREGAIGPTELVCSYFNMSFLRSAPPRPADANAKNAHNSNLITFHTVRGFRGLTC